MDWAKLTTHQLGKYAEYLVKMECTRLGLDVYTAEVDDKGIDFVLRLGPDRYVDVQVKSLRGPGYVFMRESKFEPRENLWLVFVGFPQDEAPPTIHLFPSERWLKPVPPFVHRKYEGKKSEPEYGINIAEKWMELLDEHRLDRMLVQHAIGTKPSSPA